MQARFEINVTGGDATEDQIKEFIEFTLGCGSCSQDNPFIDEDSDCEIEFSSVEID